MLDEFNIFDNEIRDNFIENYDNIISDVTNKQNEIISCTIYSLYVRTNYNKLEYLFKDHYNKLISDKKL